MLAPRAICHTVSPPFLSHAHRLRVKGGKQPSPSFHDEALNSFAVWLRTKSLGQAALAFAGGYHGSYRAYVPRVPVSR